MPWRHPDHYTEEARALALATRRADIAVFMGHVMPGLVVVARGHGYALAVHGSQARDLDLVLIPWTDEATDPDPLLDAIAGEVKRLAGWGMIQDPRWKAKPHGRQAAMILGTAEVHLDISVMPRLPA